MSTDIKWKDALLKSGLPLEYEVKAFLEREKKCLITWEQSYLRPDDDGVIKEFSYDINASYIKSPYDVEFMTECKYRTEGTKWFFMPEEYGGMDEIHLTCFMHAIDYFHSWSWDWNQYMPYCEMLGPLCSKGIEIYSNGENNSKSIRQAVSQLSYALAKQIIGTISDHIDEHGIRFREILIPVIVTTADLFRFKENITIEDIKKCSRPEDAAIKQELLIVRGNTDLSLYNHNMDIFSSFIASDEKLLQAKVNSFTKDLNHLFYVIAKHYCPQALVIVHHSEKNDAFVKLIEYINKFMFPSAELLAKRASFEKSISDSIETMKKKQLEKKAFEQNKQNDPPSSNQI